MAKLSLDSLLRRHPIFAAFRAGADERDLFTLRLRDFIGNPLDLSGADFGTVRIKTDPKKNAARIRYSDCEQLPGTEAEATVRAGADGTLFWRIAAHPGTADFQLEWVEFPRVRFAARPGTQYLLPIHEGVLVTDLERREKRASFRAKLSEYPLTGVSGFYPGPAALQMEALYAEGEGICIYCADPEHFPKGLEFLPEKNAARTMLQHFTGGGERLAYDVVITPFRGDWQDAAELYRAWMEANDPTLPAKFGDVPPPLLAASPVVVAYPVKGHGLDAGGLDPNEYYPYAAAMPVLRDLRRKFGAPVMALLMHWEGTAPWAPPFVWPPSGGEELLKAFLDAMHAEGGFVGLYASGTGWTQRSMIDPRYDLFARFEADHVAGEICRGPRGEAYSRVCNSPRGQRLGYDLCPARDYTANVVGHEIASARKLGVDYLQYFDQNQGCTSPLCYARDHGHPPLPGSWQTAAMRGLLKKAQEAAADRTVLGCENAAAEPYVGVCRLNDLRSHLAWGTGGRPVALYSYCFHEYSAGFSGNGVCLHGWVDLDRTPFFLLWHLARHFVSGDLLSVVLKDHGRIHWNWTSPWTAPGPEQEPLLTLIGRLAAKRAGAWRRFLVSGRMIKTPEIAGPTRRIFLRQQPTATVPAVPAAAWESAGERVVVLANTLERAAKCRIRWADGREQKITVPPLDAALVPFPR